MKTITNIPKTLLLEFQTTSLHMRLKKIWGHPDSRDLIPNKGCKKLELKSWAKAIWEPPPPKLQRDNHPKVEWTKFFLMRNIRASLREIFWARLTSTEVKSIDTVRNFSKTKIHTDKSLEHPNRWMSMSQQVNLLQTNLPYLSTFKEVHKLLCLQSLTADHQFQVRVEHR